MPRLRSTTPPRRSPTWRTRPATRSRAPATRSRTPATDAPAPPATDMEESILALNAGSSSLKFAVLTSSRPARRLLSGAVTRIGLPGATLTITAGTAPEAVHAIEAPDHPHALEAMLAHVEPHSNLASLSAVGHR